MPDGRSGKLQTQRHRAMRLLLLTLQRHAALWRDDLPQSTLALIDNVNAALGEHATVVSIAKVRKSLGLNQDGSEDATFWGKRRRLLEKTDA